MDIALDKGLLLLSLVFCILPGVVVWECISALFPLSRDKTTISAGEPRIAVLVPAHNEAEGIASTLTALNTQITSLGQLIVVSDNCSDNTAAIARELGATVLERNDLERRGKGYALDCGLQFLRSNPPDVLIVVDADCGVSPNLIEGLVQSVNRWGRPAQALYLLDVPVQGEAKHQVSALAFLVKNGVRPRGLARWGLPVPLMGTGMAFPWEAVQSVTWASGNIVEDLQLGIDLAVAGYGAVFCPEVRVTGCLPQGQQASLKQRTRWEHGHLRTLLNQVPRLVGEAFKQRRGDLLAMALDLSVPPLALLVLFWAIGTGLMAGAALGGLSWVPLAVMGGMGGLMAIALGSVWFKFGREQVPLSALLAIPLYFLGKIPLYFAFVVRPETQWIRTERDKK